MTSTCSSSPWFMNWDLFRGHLGPDEYLRVVERRPIGHAQEELKAESLAYLVCNRQGVNSKIRDIWVPAGT